MFFFIQGQNKMLAFYRSPALRPGVETNVEARLWPGQWFIDYRGGNRATRRDILRSGSSLYFVGRTAISVFILYRNTEYLYIGYRYRNESMTVYIYIRVCSSEIM